MKFDSLPLNRLPDRVYALELAKDTNKKPLKSKEICIVSFLNDESGKLVPSLERTVSSSHRVWTLKKVKDYFESKGIAYQQ